jgi:IS30 family transposase
VGAGMRNIPNRVPIQTRPPIVAKRSRYGDWEMDLIQSANDKEFIVTLIERRTRYLLMAKLGNGKNAECVAQAVIKLLFPYKKNVLSPTTDNGGEFAKHTYICSQLPTVVYFADPYSSWQKGTVENTNKLIRQYIPKGCNFNTLSNNDIY